MKRALVLGLLVLWNANAGAQANCTGTGIPSTCTTARTLSMTIRPTVRATITPTEFDFNLPTADDYNLGYSQALGHVIQVQSNTTWTLTIRSNQTKWTATGGGNTNKQRTDLEWATSAGGPYTAEPGNGGATALTVASGNATSSTIVNVYYRVLWSWTADTPGTYSLPMIFLISAP